MGLSSVVLNNNSSLLKYQDGSIPTTYGGELFLQQMGATSELITTVVGNWFGKEAEARSLIRDQREQIIAAGGGDDMFRQEIGAIAKEDSNYVSKEKKYADAFEDYQRRIKGPYTFETQRKAMQESASTSQDIVNREALKLGAHRPTEASIAVGAGEMATQMATPAGVASLFIPGALGATIGEKVASAAIIGGAATGASIPLERADRSFMGERPLTGAEEAGNVLIGAAGSAAIVGGASVLGAGVRKVFNLPTPEARPIDLKDIGGAINRNLNRVAGADADTVDRIIATERRAFLESEAQAARDKEAMDAEWEALVARLSAEGSEGTEPWPFGGLGMVEYAEAQAARDKEIVDGIAQSAAPGQTAAALRAAEAADTHMQKWSDPAVDWKVQEQSLKYASEAERILSTPTKDHSLLHVEEYNQGLDVAAKQIVEGKPVSVQFSEPLQAAMRDFDGTWKAEAKPMEATPLRSAEEVATVERVSRFTPDTPVKIEGQAAPAPETVVQTGTKILTSADGKTVLGKASISVEGDTVKIQSIDTSGAPKGKTKVVQAIVDSVAKEFRDKKVVFESLPAAVKTGLKKAGYEIGADGSVTNPQKAVPDPATPAKAGEELPKNANSPLDGAKAPEVPSEPLTLRTQLQEAFGAELGSAWDALLRPIVRAPEDITAATEALSKAQEQEDLNSIFQDLDKTLGKDTEAATPVEGAPADTPVQPNESDFEVFIQNEDGTSVKVSLREAEAKVKSDKQELDAMSVCGRTKK